MGYFAFGFLFAVWLWQSLDMIKPKKARKGDSVQVAHSVFSDVIKLSQKPIKAPAKISGKPRRK